MSSVPVPDPRGLVVRRHLLESASVCADAWKSCQPSGDEVPLPADLAEAPQVDDSDRLERRGERLARAVEAIPDPELRAILWEMKQGVSLRTSAANRRISPRTLYRRRQAGLVWLRHHYQTDWGAPD